MVCTDSSVAVHTDTAYIHTLQMDDLRPQLLSTPSDSPDRLCYAMLCYAMLCYGMLVGEKLSMERQRRPDLSMLVGELLLWEWEW